MSMGVDNYFYTKQIKKWILNFSNIFSNTMVNIGSEDEPKLIKCGMINVNAQNTVVSLLTSGSQNEILQLPLIGIRFEGISEDFNNAHGTNVIRRVKMQSPKTKKRNTLYDIMPRPYLMHLETQLWASDEDQLFEMFEQLSVLFDPTLDLRSSDKIMDWGRISFVKLKNVSTVYTDKISEKLTAFSMNLSFELPMWIGMPAIVKDNVIKQIQVNLGNPHLLLTFDQKQNKLVPYIVPNDPDSPYYADTQGRPIIINEEDIPNVE